jgi:ribosome-associated protein
MPKGFSQMSDENWIIVNKQLGIPRSELEFRFSTSSGPGGQHANRSATRVTLIFDVARSPALDEETRAKLLLKLASRLDKDGVLQIDVQESRSQWRNREEAVARFQALLADALRPVKPRRKTKPPQAAKEDRLAEKKKRGKLKKERGRQWQSE